MNLYSILKVTVIAMVVVNLTACGDSNVKTEIKSLLIDPSSAQFKSITVFKNGNYCGEVNSKNKMGGYAGYKAFSKVDGKLEIHDIFDLERLCEIAKDPVTYKCSSLKKDLKILDDELKKDQPLKSYMTREVDEKIRGRIDAEYTMLMCANR
jgi:hypothetical protein